MKIKYSLIFILIMLIMPCSINAYNENSKERERLEEPYLIYTAEDLKKIGNDEKWSLDKHYKLMNDIVLEKPKEGESNWIPIGTLENPFTGVFDGNNKTITGIVIETAESNGIGFFGYVNGEHSIIKALGILDVSINLDKTDISQGCKTGALVGSNTLGTIINCYSTGNITGGKISTGGLIGITNGGVIERCYSKVNVQDDRKYESNMVGGLIGYANNCYINDQLSIEPIVQRCYTTGNVYGTGNAGGLIGRIHSGTLENCYSIGDIKGQMAAGGLIGVEGNCIIKNCYFVGNVIGEENVISLRWPKSTGRDIDGEVGGICGWGSYITNCIILSEKIESYGYILGYITSDDKLYGESGKIEGNYILEDTKLISYSFTPTRFISNKNAFKSKEELTSQKTYEEIGWKFTGEDAVWEFSGEYKLPKLIGIGGQDELMTPEYLL